MVGSVSNFSSSASELIISLRDDRVGRIGLPSPHPIQPRAARRTGPLQLLAPSSRLGGGGGLLAEQRVGGLLLHIR